MKDYLAQDINGARVENPCFRSLKMHTVVGKKSPTLLLGEIGDTATAVVKLGLPKARERAGRDPSPGSVFLS